MIRILVFGMSTGMGGVESYLMNLYRNLDHQKIQLDFLVEGDSCFYAEEINSLGGKVFFVTKRKISIFYNIYDLLQIFKHVKKTHRILYFNLSALYYNPHFIVAKLFKFPVVIAHGHSTRDKKEKKNIRHYLHCINRIYVTNTADYLFACSKSAGEWVLGKNALEKGRITIIPNAISMENYIYNHEVRQSIRDELEINKNHFVIGNVGRLSYVKNQSYLLDIFKEIHTLNKETTLLLVGDGELKLELEEKALKLGINKNVVFTGARTDVQNLLQAMDVFVMPSHFEGLPFSLIEAQAAGLKCIASKEAITAEANITGLVHYLNLEIGAAYWAKEIIDLSGDYKRKDMSTFIKSSGYDIKETTIKLEKLIYEKMV